MSNPEFNRRIFLRGAAMLGGAAAAGPILTACGDSGSSGAALTKLSVQGGWLASEGQMGEAIALSKGWFEEEGIDFSFNPGGPTVDGVGLVSSQQSKAGQISSSPSLMLAADQGIPVKAFAVGVQSQPYAYVSLPDNPVREPKDLIGKTVGTQSTGQILLDALLKTNDIDPSEVNVEIVAADITPLTTGRVDVWTGWITNVAAMRPLNGEYETLMLSDAGVRLYGYPYYAHESVVTKEADLLERFVRATSRGWAYAAENLSEAAEAVTKLDPSLKAADIEAAGKVLLPFAFDQETANNGWGAMDPSAWQEQIDLYDSLGEFKGGAPALEDVATMSILEATANDRPKVGA